MAKFTKEIVAPGKYVVNVPTKQADGTIKLVRKEQEITEDRINSWVEKFKKMRDKGLNFPAPFYHDFSALPITEEEKARLDAEQRKEENRTKNNAGYWESLFYKDGKLQGIIDADEAYSERFGKSFKECSLMSLPKFTDGLGEEWEDPILHIAVVTHPIAPGQGNFEKLTDAPEEALSVAMSQALPEGTVMSADDTAPKLLSLDLNENLVTGEVYFSGRFKKETNALDLLSKFKSYVQDMKEGKDVYLNNSVAVAFSQAVPTLPLKKEDGTAMSLGDILSLLPSINITLPADTAEANFLDRLYTALTAVAASKTTNPSLSAQSLSLVPGGPTLMGTAIDVNSPEGKFRMKQQLNRLQGRIKPLYEKGVINKEYIEKTLQPMMSGLAMSLELTEEGELPLTPVDAVLDALENLPFGNAANGQPLPKPKKTGEVKVEGMSLSVGDEPEEALAEVTEEQSEAFVKQFLSNVGMKPTKYVGA